MHGIDLFNVGFHHLVSVVPPDATLSPNSKLQMKDRGKSPGVRNAYGQWAGYPWLKTNVTPQLVQQWTDDGAGFGLAGSYYPGIDIDVMVPEIAQRLQQVALQMLPGAPVRIGRDPKSMIMLRSPEPLRSFDMRYSCEGKPDELIQFVARGRHYVVSGIHPDTRKPYRIEPEDGLRLWGPGALPTVSAEQVNAVFDALTAVMQEFGYTCRNVARADGGNEVANQQDLQAPSLEALQEVVAQLPNEIENRDEWIAAGYAIKAAWPEDEEAAFDVFMEWCDRWEGGYNDPELVRYEWDKMKPPFQRGFSWISGEAGKHGVSTAQYEWVSTETAQSAPSPIDSLFGGPMPTVAGDMASASDSAALAAYQERKAERIESGDSGFIEWSDKALADEIDHITEDFLLRSKSQGDYLHWDGRLWRGLNADRTLTRMVDQFLRKKSGNVHESLTGKKAGDMQTRLGSSGLQSTLVKLLTDRMETDLSLLDWNRDLINTPEGPYDLRTGELLPPDRKQYMTRCTYCAPDMSAEPTRWLQFLNESMGGDQEMVTWLRRYCGYSLTGHVREQIFPMFLGSGGNGKSVFTKVLTKIMGEYARLADVQLFQTRRVGGSDINPQREMAHLHGSRLVLTSETRSGGYWDELRVKQLTGDDKIEAREIYEKKFEYEATFSLLIVGNYAPEMHAVGDSMQRRMRLVPWDNRPATVDKELVDKLLAEAPAIFGWMMRGAQEWYAHGLNEPEAIANKTAMYLEGEDVVSHWAKQLVYGPGRKANLVRLYQDYVAFCAAQHVQHVGKAKFRRQAEDVLGKRRVGTEGNAADPMFIGCQPKDGPASAAQDEYSAHQP